MKKIITACVILVLLNSCTVFERTIAKHRFYDNRIYLAYISHKPEVLRPYELHLDSSAIAKLNSYIDTNQYYFLKLKLINVAIYESENAIELREFLIREINPIEPTDSAMKLNNTNVCYFTKRKSDIERIIKCYENNKLIINFPSGFGFLSITQNNLEFLNFFVVYKNKKQLKKYTRYEKF